MALFAALVVRWLARSLVWPLIGDATLFHYAAWRISEGAVPYRDVFDFQFPVTLLTHLLVVKLLGTGDVAWRAFDLVWLAAGCAALWRFLRPFGVLPTCAASLMFCTWHLLLGAWETGQRDFCMAVLILSALAFLAHALEDHKTSRRVFATGSLIGWATMIKPLTIVLAVALVPFVLRVARKSGLSRRRVLSEYAVGFAILPAVCCAWLWISGGLPAFIDIVLRYLPSVHHMVEYKPGWSLLASWLTSHWAAQLYSLAALVLLSAALLRCFSVRIGLLLVGTLYGLFHFAIQEKGWLYHYEPAAICVCALSALSLSGPRQAGDLPAGRRARLERYSMMAMRCVGMILYATAIRDVSGRVESRGGIRSGVAAHRARVDSIRADLRTYVHPGGTAQVMDWMQSGAEALLREHIVAATRLTLDHPMFVDAGSPYVSELRAQFIADLRSRRPDVIILCRWAQAPGLLRQIERFDGLAELLRECYHLEVERPEYAVFVPNSR